MQSCSMWVYSVLIKCVSVLRQVARSIIVCPGWNEIAENPLVLVHGVYGSGKSFLAAVIIMFIQDIIDTATARREPDDTIQFKILISSMTVSEIFFFFPRERGREID